MVINIIIIMEIVAMIKIIMTDSRIDDIPDIIIDIPDEFDDDRGMVILMIDVVTTYDDSSDCDNCSNTSRYLPRVIANVLTIILFDESLPLSTT